MFSSLINTLNKIDTYRNSIKTGIIFPVQYIINDNFCDSIFNTYYLFVVKGNCNEYHHITNYIILQNDE